MDTLRSWLDGLVSLLPAGLAQTLVRAGIVQLVIAVVLVAVVQLIERHYRPERAAYLTRPGFRHDLAYWFYYRTGLASLLYTAALLALLEKPLSFLDIGLGADLPVPVVILLAFVAGDAMGYFVHRLQHRYALLWAFHTTHHSQRDMNVLTGARFHPLDALLLALFAYIPMRIIGGTGAMWPWLALTLWTINMLIHSRIPWSYGPLYKVVVSPAFHAFHHSTLPEHHDRNFSSGMLSIWDYLFGTAVKDASRVPQVFGLPELESKSLLDTLVAPFRLLGRTQRKIARELD